MKKMTNTQKILKALRSGPKTQADLIRETKVKNVYQIVSDLRKKKIAFMDTANCVNLRPIPLAADETDKMDVHQARKFVEGATRYKVSSSPFSKKEVPITLDEASKLKAKHTSQFVHETTKAKIEKANHDRIEFSGPRSHICISMLTDEIENINAGIRALTITKSYLQRRIEEERSRA